MLIDERLGRAPDPPDVPAELETRQIQRERLRLYFLAHLGEDVEPETLTRLVGPNYRSRIAELPFNVENVPRFLTHTDGKRQRLIGAYRYRPAALGRSAETPVSGQRALF